MITQKPLGNTEQKICSISLGTMMWGDQVDSPEAENQMSLALDRGVDFWDTAEMYTIPMKSETCGRTEEIIGNFFSKNPSARSKVFLATKVCGQGSRSIPWIRDGQHSLSKANITDAIEGSLRRLQTDFVDLYQIHWPDRLTNYFGVRDYQHQMQSDNESLENTLLALVDLVKSGKIRHIGVSNETPWGLMKYKEFAKKHHLSAVASIQNPYNLLSRVADTGLSEICLREDISFFAYSPLAMGVLSGKYQHGHLPIGSRRERFPDYASRYSNHHFINEALAEYEKIAKNFNLSLTELALGFVSSREFITSAIVGATNCDQLTENINACQNQLSEEVLVQIDKVHQKYPNPCV